MATNQQISTKVSPGIRLQAWLAQLRWVIALVFCVLGFCGTSFAEINSVAEVNSVTIDSSQRYDLGRIVYLYEGDTRDWKSVAESPLSEGVRNDTPTFNTDTHRPPVWMRMEINTGSETADEEWLLSFNNSFGGDLSFYVVIDGKIDQKIIHSRYTPFFERPYIFRDLTFPVSLPSNTQLTLLVKVEATPMAAFTPTLYSKSVFEATELVQWAWQGFALGVLAALMFYHLVLAAATFDKVYLYYSAMLAVNCLWLLSVEGFSFQYFWPNQPIFEWHALIVITYLPVLFAIAFTIKFLELPTISKRFSYFYYVMASLLFSLSVLRAFNTDISMSLLSLLVVFIYFSFIYAGVFALKHNVTYARYYLLAWSIYCLTIINLMFSLSGLPAIFSDYSYYIMVAGFDLQVLLLALALASRIRSMRDSKLQADADNRAKSEFLARMSHEIRTPLSGVLGMADLLSDRLKDPTNIHYLNTIRSSGVSLLTIINDILDYSKFAAGKLEMESIPFNIQQLAVDSLDIFKAKAAEKNVELIADFDLTMPTYLMGDPTRIKQVMLNFISNAVKFTDTGQIVLRVEAVKNSEDMVKIAVSDSGMGISKEQQNTLFEAFSQADKSTARKFGGTGLGLSICKQLAHFMQGEIGVHSEQGKGATFWITAKLPACQEKLKEVDVADVSLQGLNLLIVEDNFTFADLLQVQAESWGMQCVVANNGEEALKQLETNAENGVIFDLISLDLTMPLMDGLETSRRIQADQRFQHIPRLLLTSATNFPSQKTLAAAGISKVVDKPALPSELQTIYKFLLAKGEKTSAPENKPAQENKKALESLSILVAEDNNVNQMVIKGILQRFDQEVELVANGEDAVELVTRQQKPYDLILMDSDMPVMDGNTATRKIRQWEQEQQLTPIKIVALSAHAVQSQIDACYAAGVDDYLSKPIEIKKLESLLVSLSNDKTTALKAAI